MNYGAAKNSRRSLCWQELVAKWLKWNCGSRCSVFRRGEPSWRSLPYRQGNTDQASQAKLQPSWLDWCMKKPLNQTAIRKTVLVLRTFGCYLMTRCTAGYQPGHGSRIALGEYSALGSGGAFDLEDEAALVTSVAFIWKSVDLQALGRYASFLIPGWSDWEALQQLSKRGVVTPANYNTPSRTVIGGGVVLWLTTQLELCRKQEQNDWFL